MARAAYITLNEKVVKMSKTSISVTALNLGYGR